MCIGVGRIIDISIQCDQAVVADQRIASDHDGRVRQNNNRSGDCMLCGFATIFVDQLNSIVMDTRFRHDSDCVEVVTRDLEAIFEPTISSSGIRISSQSDLSAFTDSVIAKDIDTIHNRQSVNRDVD